MLHFFFVRSPEESVPTWLIFNTCILILLIITRVCKFLADNPHLREESTPGSNDDPSVRYSSWPDDHWKSLKQGRLQMPEFTLSTMMKYFIQRKLTDCVPVGDVSSFDKALRLFKKGYVQKVEVCCKPKDHTFFVRASVHATMKDTLYGVQLAVYYVDRIVKDILWAKCGCPAGRGPKATCKHLAALFYGLESFCRLGYCTDMDVSVTSKLCQWNIPRKRKLDSAESECMDFKCPKRPTLLPVLPSSPKKRAPPVLRGYFRDPRPMKERNTVQKRIWPALDVLHATGKSAGVMLLLSGLHAKEKRERQERLARRDAKQRPWLALRESAKQKEATSHYTGNFVADWMKDQTARLNESLTTCFHESLPQPPTSGCPALHESSENSTMLGSDEHSGSDSDSESTDNLSDSYNYSEDPVLAYFAEHVYQQWLQVDLQNLPYQPRIPGPVFWGGKVRGIQLTNTCPLDNFLTIFWTAAHNSALVRKTLMDDNAIFSKVLVSALQLMNQGKDAEAKLKWAEFLGLHANALNVINFHGSQHTRFVRFYNDTWLQSTIASTCRDCTHEQSRQAEGLILSSGDLAAAHDVGNEVRSSLEPSPGVCSLCGGVKDWGKRVFRRRPPLLIFEVPPERSQILDYDLKDFPPLLSLAGDHFDDPPLANDVNSIVSYMLVGGTYSDGAHFRGAFLSAQVNELFGHGWYSYDGLTGSQLEGPLAPATPAGSRLSYVLYSVLSKKYAREASRLKKWMDNE